MPQQLAREKVCKKTASMAKQFSNIVCCVLQAVNGYPMEPSPSAVAAVEYALRRLCSWLVHGKTTILFLSAFFLSLS